MKPVSKELEFSISTIAGISTLAKTPCCFTAKTARATTATHTRNSDQRIRAYGATARETLRQQETGGIETTSNQCRITDAGVVFQAGQQQWGPHG